MTPDGGRAHIIVVEKAPLHQMTLGQGRGLGGRPSSAPNALLTRALERLLGGGHPARGWRSWVVTTVLGQGQWGRGVLPNSAIGLCCVAAVGGAAATPDAGGWGALRCAAAHVQPLGVSREYCSGRVKRCIQPVNHQCDLMTGAQGLREPCVCKA